MKAIILAAGRGSRMKGLTDERPKCLIEFEGRTLLDWQLGALREAGITQIGIVTGYRHALLDREGLTPFHNPDWAQTQMLSSLCAAHDWLAQDDCIVSYSDIVYEAEAIRTLMGCSDDIAITYDEQWLSLWTRRFGDPLLDAETFQFDATQHLTNIGQRPQSVGEVMGQYMGLLKFTPRGWARVRQWLDSLPPEQARRTHMTGMLSALVSGGHSTVKVLPYRGFWSEFDHPDDLLAVQRDATAGRAA